MIKKIADNWIVIFFIMNDLMSQNSTYVFLTLIKTLIRDSFIRLSLIRPWIRMNRKKKQAKTVTKKKKQNMHGIHRHQAKREEKIRTEARNRNSVRICEGMSATCL